MTNCKKCNQIIPEDANFCASCGAGFRGKNATDRNGASSFLKALCILTIMGSLFTIGRALLYEMFSELDHTSDYIRGWIYAGTAIGTIIGAVLMMQQKLNGLYMYTVFQVIYIITVLVAVFSYGEFSNVAFIVALFFLIPSITFLILYWTNMIRKDLI